MIYARHPRAIPDARRQSIAESAYLAAEPVLASESAPGLAEPIPPPPRRDSVNSSLDSVRESLRELAGPHRRGAVPALWTSYGILTCLGLAYHLKPTASLSMVLALAASLFFGPGGSELVNDIRAGRIALPSLELMRQARIRLDILVVCGRGLSDHG